MVLTLNTDWSKIRYMIFIIYSTSALLASTVATGLNTSGKQKRQLFREHVIPQQGGKIPENALKSDRLFLNKLNQNGLYSPDGLHFEQNNIFPDRKYNSDKNTLQINIIPDSNRYIAPPGRYYDYRSIDTTYLIREPVDYAIFPLSLQYLPSPYPPNSSLKLLYQNKYNKLLKGIFKSSILPINHHQVLREFAPYLKKLHEINLE